MPLGLRVNLNTKPSVPLPDMATVNNPRPPLPAMSALFNWPAEAGLLSQLVISARAQALTLMTPETAARWREGTSHAQHAQGQWMGR